VLQNGLIAMQTQARVMLRVANHLVHERTSAPEAAARSSAAGEAFRENRMAWNARGWLANGGTPWGPRRPLAPMLVDAAEALQPRAAPGSGGESA
jgi:hypothetical protein